MEILIVGTENSGKTLLTRQIKEWIHNKSLSKHSIVDNVAGPTIGVDITDLHLPNLHIMSNINNVSPIPFKVRELGSAIASKWHTYFDDADGIIFTIDCSEISTWSNSICLLYECVHYFISMLPTKSSTSSCFISSNVDSNEAMLRSYSTHQTLQQQQHASQGIASTKCSKRKPLLVLFTKMDIVDSLSMYVLQDMMRLEEILEKSGNINCGQGNATFPLIEVLSGCIFDDNLINAVVKWMQSTLSSADGPR